MPNCKSCRWEYTQSSPEEDMCSTCYDAIMKSKKIKRSTTMKTCKDCAFWENYNDYHGQIEEPIDPDTYRPMDIGFDVKGCVNFKEKTN